MGRVGCSRAERRMDDRQECQTSPQWHKVGSKKPKYSTFYEKLTSTLCLNKPKSSAQLTYLKVSQLELSNLAQNRGTLGTLYNQKHVFLHV